MGNVVDEYLARLPAEQKDALQQLRVIIRSVVPDADETIRSGVPSFRYRRRPLVGIGAAKRHVALYVMFGKVLERYRDELIDYDATNSVIRFSPARPLPAALVRKIVMARVAELEGTNS